MTLLEYAEQVSPVPLMDWQRKFFEMYEQAEKERKKLVFIPSRTCSRAMTWKILSDWRKSVKNE